MNTPYKYFLYVVFATAIAVRLAYFFQFAGTPFYLVPMWDAGEYHDMALALSKGSLHSSFAFRPILYPLLLGIVYILFGAGPLVPSLLQIAAGVYACLLVQRIAARLFGQWAGLGAGVAAALSGMMVFYDLELMPTSLETLLLLLLLNELLKFVDNNGGGEGSKGRSVEFSGIALRAGLWLALGILARPVILPLAPVIVVWMWSVKAGWKQMAKFAGIGLSSLALTALFNFTAGNGAMMTPAQGGVNFYIGNRPGADGFTATLPGVGAGWSWDTIKKLAEHEEGRALTSTEVDNYYWKRGLAEIASDPWGWVKLQWRKGNLFSNRLEISNDRDLYFHAHRYPIIGMLLLIGFPLALPFAFAGVWLESRDRRVMLLAAMMVFYAATVSLFFVNARFRHPLTPILFVLASGGIAWIVGSFRQKSFRWNNDTAGAGAAIIAGFASLFAVDAGIDPRRWDYGYFSEGTALEQLGRTGEAEILYLKALQVNPRAPFVNFNLGELEHKRGRLDRAAEYYDRETVIQPNYGRAWENLGRVRQSLGDDDGALECFETALRVRPDLHEAAASAASLWRERAAAAGKAGDKGLETRALERARRLERTIGSTSP